MKHLSRLLFLVIYFVLVVPLLAGQGSDYTLNVMTYNIQQGSYYNPQTTPIAVSEIVLKNNIDFLGSQELGMSAVKSLITFLPDYDWFGVGRDDGKELGETGVIFYNKEKFTLLEQSTFWLSETPDIAGSKSWNSADVRIVTWGKFIINADSSIIYVFNTHYDHISSLAREESSKLLVKKIFEIAGQNPVVLTGDFNATKGSTEYNLLVNSYYQYLRLYDTKFISQTPSTGPSGTFNNFTTDNPTSKIDFVFVNPFFDVLSLAVIPDKYDGKFISDHYPVKVELKIKRPVPPVTPKLTAVSGDNKVSLYWDSISEKETTEPFTDSSNDFQGYKLYKSRTPDMEDAVLVPGKWNVPLLRKPIMECDLIDDIYGYTNYGIVDGFGYYLGSNTGLRHYYIDQDVQNGTIYYYVLIAFDKGIPDMADGFPPMETPFTLNVDTDGNVINKSSNVAFAKPQAPQSGAQPQVVFEPTDYNGSAAVDVRVIDPAKLRQEKYKLKFDVDTLSYHAVLNEKYRSSRDVFIINTGFKIISMETDSVIYHETPDNYSAQNILLNTYKNYHYLNTTEPVITDEIDGFQMVINNTAENAEYDVSRSGWKTGSGNITIMPSLKEAVYFPWNYEIRFGEAYTGLTSTSKGIYDMNGNILAYTQVLLNQNFDFTVVNKDFNDEKLDMVIYDTDMDGVYNPAVDKILVGYCIQLANKVYWTGTIFAISFENMDGVLPQAGDVYDVYFKRPFLDTDEFVFSITPGATSVESDNDNKLPTDFSLEQNYPNPFNNATVIKYAIAKAGRYKMSVYNVLGQKVATLIDSDLQPGSHSVNFDAASLSSGVYIYSITGAGKTVTKKMVFLK